MRNEKEWPIISFLGFKLIRKHYSWVSITVHWTDMPADVRLDYNAGQHLHQ